MKFVWFMMSVVVAILVKEHFCEPSIRQISQRGIVFPVDNWDDCFLDEASTQPGLCKLLEECDVVLKQWDENKIYPKICHFIKKQMFVCCPLASTIQPITTTDHIKNIIDKVFTTIKPGVVFLDDNINNQNEDIILGNLDKKVTRTTTSRPSNIFLDNLKNKTDNKVDSTTTYRPSNIFLDNLKNKTFTTTKKPVNIFLENVNAIKTTSKMPTILTPDFFNTENPSFVKKRSETECDLQYPQNLDTFNINGAPSELKQFPFMAALGWQSKSDGKFWYPCGGALISQKFVLTSAHCADIGGESPSYVRLGDKNLTDSQEGAIKIQQFIVHPQYNATTFYSDIALVELEHEANNSIGCLWIQHDLPPFVKLTALGFGHSNFESINSNQFFETSLSAINKSECERYYKLENTLKDIDILDGHLCAGETNNAHNLCQGDTGGPLLMELERVFYVVGLTSFGLGCADLPPTIYTRVSSFIDWIEPIVWPEIDVRFDKKYSL